ncbi:hypothetical protein IAT38_005729 [Cryptococcus sp. DSM 104549]
MAFNTYHEGLKVASDLASKAILAESSLSSISPLSSPLPTLQKAFPIYISSAEAYSHLLSSKLVPPGDVQQVKKKWRLVLERAEKIKARIEQLGGRVGKAQVGDEGEEAAVLRRGSSVNGVEVDLWVEPSGKLDAGEEWRDREQPELAEAQLSKDPEWREVPRESWGQGVKKGEWVMMQGPVADCSVVAAMGVGLEHEKRFGTKFGWNNLYPQCPSGQPRRSENGKHVLKLLLNGAWRSVIFDTLLPHSRMDNSPLYTTCHPASPSSSTAVGAPWAPLALKGYYKVHGGYSFRGSNPAPDIYSFTGWIPERLGLREGFQREKEWGRLREAWGKGDVMVSLGTGEVVGQGLVKLHAYGVLGLREQGEERWLDIIDPGAAAFSMSWDRVCAEFEALHLNWNPALVPTVATRHWSWAKPIATGNEQTTVMTNPQYRLHVTAPPTGNLPEIWILLSQHITSTDRPLDDIALYVFEEYGTSGRGRMGMVNPERIEKMTPYANNVHVLARYQLRRPSSTLLIIPARDHGIFQTGFTLQALSPASTTLSLERVSRTMPFSETISGSLTSRNAGGHPGWPSHMVNPQYRLEVKPPPRGGAVKGRVMLYGDMEVAWNVRLLWGQGELVFDLSEDMVLADTGAYSFGMAYCDIPDIKPGTYTMIVSAFDPGKTGPYSVAIGATAPVSISPIPAEGSGMFSRVVHGRWTEETAGGRPSTGTYERNSMVEVILPKPGTLLARLYLPARSPAPINLTIFKRGPGGSLGEQAATTGPYSDALTGVSTGRVKLDAGLYVAVPSTYEKAKGEWVLKVWADVALSTEAVK